MYCPNCHTYHDANSRFCSACGAQLVEPQQTAQQPNPQQGAWAPPYGAAQPPAAQPSNVLPIVSLIVSILLGNLIGILLAAFSLVNYNRGTAALQQRDFEASQMFAQKSRKLAIGAIVVSAVCCVLIVICAIAAFAFGIFNGVHMNAPFVEFNYADPQIPMALAALFG